MDNDDDSRADEDAFLVSDTGLGRRFVSGQNSVSASMTNMLYLAAHTRNRAAVYIHAAHTAGLQEVWTDWLAWHGNAVLNTKTKNVAWGRRFDNTFNANPRMGYVLKVDDVDVSLKCVPSTPCPPPHAGLHASHDHAESVDLYKPGGFSVD